MHEVAEGVWSRAREWDERVYATWAGALCSLASASANRLADARAELAEVESACAALSDEQLAERIDVLGYIAQASSLLERSDDAVEYARRGLRVAQTTGQTPFIPGLLVLEANGLFMRGRIVEAAAVAETATDAAVLTGNDQFAMWALWADAMACSAAGDTARALASAREAAARADRMAETFFSSLSRLHLAAALNAAGDAAGARAELAAFEAGPDQRLLDLRAGLGWELLIQTQLSVGDWHAAVESARTAEARARTTSLPQRTAIAVCARAAVLLAGDDPPGAARAAREAIPLADSTGNPVLGARARALLGAALGRLGELEPAIAELEYAERTLSEAGAMREADAAAQELRRLGWRGPRRARGGAAGARIGRSEPTRARGGHAGGRRQAQPRGRRRSVPEREDRREPPRAYLRQARRALAGGARDDPGRGRLRAGEGLAQQGARDALTAAVQAGRDRRLARAQRAGGLAVGEAHEIHGDDRVAVLRRRAGDRLHDLAAADLGVASLELEQVGLEQLPVARARGRAPVAAVVGVSQGPQQVADLVAVAQPPRSLEHVQEGLLDEVLGVVSGSAQGPGRPEQLIDVARERIRFEQVRLHLATRGVRLLAWPRAAVRRARWARDWWRRRRSSWQVHLANLGRDGPTGDVVGQQRERRRLVRSPRPSTTRSARRGRTSRAAGHGAEGSRSPSMRRRRRRIPPAGACA